MSLEINGWKPKAITEKGLTPGLGARTRELIRPQPL